MKRVYKEQEKVKILCKKYNIADINEFIAYYLQYSDIYNTKEELIQKYKEEILLYNEYDY